MQNRTRVHARGNIVVESLITAERDGLPALRESFAKSNSVGGGLAAFRNAESRMELRGQSMTVISEGVELDAANQLTVGAVRRDAVMVLAESEGFAAGVGTDSDATLNIDTEAFLLVDGTESLPVRLTAGTELSLLSDTTMRASANADADSSGVGGADADAHIRSRRIATATGLNHAVLRSGARTVQEAHSDKRLIADAKAFVGFGAASANSSVNGSAGTGSTSSSIIGENVSRIDMLAEDPALMMANSLVERRDPNSVAAAVANSVVDFSTEAVTEIDGETRLNSPNIQISAAFDSVKTNAVAIVSGGKSTDNVEASATNSKIVTAIVNVAPTVTMNAESLTIEAVVQRAEDDSYSRTASVPGGVLPGKSTEIVGLNEQVDFRGTNASGLTGSQQKTSQAVTRRVSVPVPTASQKYFGTEVFRNEVNFSGTVTLGPLAIQQPRAIISDTGEILELSGLAITEDGKSLFVGDRITSNNARIVQQGKSSSDDLAPSFVINAPLGTVTGIPTVHLKEAADTMIIHSDADFHLTLGDIDLQHGVGSRTRRVISGAGNNRLMADVDSNAADSQMIVEILCDVFLDGHLLNPGGQTEIRVVMGDLIALPGAVIHTRLLSLRAETGEIQNLPVEFVISSGFAAGILEAFGAEGVALDLSTTGAGISGGGVPVSVTLSGLQSTTGPIDVEIFHHEEDGSIDPTSFRLDTVNSGSDLFVVEYAPAELNAGSLAILQASSAGTMVIQTDRRVDILPGALLTAVTGLEIRSEDDLAIRAGSRISSNGWIRIAVDWKDDFDSEGALLLAGGDVIGRTIHLSGGLAADRFLISGALDADAIVLDGHNGSDRYTVSIGRLVDSITLADTGVNGVDELSILGTDRRDEFRAGNQTPNGVAPQIGGFVSISGLATSETSIRYTTSLEKLRIDGLAGSDVFVVQPSQTTTITLDGGLATALSLIDVDVLRFDSFGHAVTRQGTTLLTNGGQPASFQPVHVFNIDITPPRATLNPLPQLWTTSRTITLDIALTDIAGAAGEPVSGVAFYNLYMATDLGPWTLLAANLPASQKQFSFTSESGRQYWFRAVALDFAENLEVEPAQPSVEANTRTADFDAPVTEVTAAVLDLAAGKIQVNFRGQDSGGSGLREFRLFVSIDGAPAEQVPGSPVVLPDSSSGLKTGSIVFSGLRDGVSHSYRFFTVGVDRAGNVEAAPTVTGDIIVSAVFAQQPSTPVGIDVQKGQLQRSYVRYVDVLFSDSRTLQELIDRSGFRVERFDISTSNPVIGAGALVSGFSLRRRLNAVELDFGAAGIGGSGVSGNGFYRVSLDLDNDGQYDDAHFEFFRLFGDANGNGAVETNDQQLLFEDLNGDGRIDARDRLDARNQVGRRLNTNLLSWLDD